MERLKRKNDELIWLLDYMRKNYTSYGTRATLGVHGLHACSLAISYLTDFVDKESCRVIG